MSPWRCKRRTPVVCPTGVFHWWPRSKDLQVRQRESSCHDRRRLSSALSRSRCRLLVPRFFASACVAFLPAVRCFISVLIVIAGSVIAVPVAGKNRAVSNAVRLTAAITKVSAGRGASIIASANASIASA